MHVSLAGMFRFFLIALTGALAGCGWAEWPPASGPYLASPPPRNAPTARTPAPPSSGEAIFRGAESVVVALGDTVYSLSRRHDVTTRDIIGANGLQPPYTLRVGQRIVLPRGQTHRVAKGDTLYNVSRRYGVDMHALARANNVAPPYTIHLGETLRIPRAAIPAEAVAPAAPSSTPSAPPPARIAGPLPRGAGTVPAAIPRPPDRKGGGFLWPVQGRVMLGFGAQGKGRHNDGINIAAARGTPIRAIENGVVAYAGNEIRGYGNLVLVKHEGGWMSAYGHAERLHVKRGDRIERGQVIGEVGSSGNVEAPQLHFELRRGTDAVDPMGHLTRT